MPAINSSRSEPSTWESSSGWPSLSLAFISVEIRSSVGCVLALLDMAGEISAHLLDRLHQLAFVLDAEFEDHVDPFDEEIAILLGDAEHVGDGAHRNVFGVARRRVAFAVGDELVDQLVADGANPRLQLLHRIRRERRQQQLLGRLVLGRIGRDRRRGVSRDLRAARRAR